jgi:DNA-binding XRE family transcriptional regulator
MTQEDVAKVLHLQPSTVGMYEQDRRMPSLNVVVTYINLFSVSADFLVWDKLCTTFQCCKKGG